MDLLIFLQSGPVKPGNDIILPEIEGVLVVAEGGDSPRIVSDISDAVKALFQVEAHRIKVIKMI